MFQHLPLELTEAILDYIDNGTLRNTLRTATFLRYPSEKRLYYRVSLSTGSTKGLGGRQVRFLDTVLRTSRLAQHVVKLVMGGCAPAIGGDPQVNSIIGQAMKNMINLKELEIFGYPYILHARLDSVPFSLTHFFMSGEKVNDTDDLLPFVSILQAHPNLEELALDYSPLPPELVAALKAEEEGIAPESGILCPHLRRFDGYDDGLRLFFPRRRIESGTTMGSGAELIDDEDLVDVWLTPVLTSSYRHLRILEVWTDRHKNTCFLSTIAPYLTSLTHLLILDHFTVIDAADYLLLSLGQIPALESVTLTDLYEGWITVSEARDMVDLVCAVCPDIAEIFVGGDESPVFYHYTKGKGLHNSLVDKEVAYRPYTRWLREP